VSFLRRKLATRRIWRRILYERLTEPLHLNLISLFVAAFGSFRTRVAYDLVVRQHHAYAILRCADLARAHGIRELTLVEFGVAAGAGLLNMCRIAQAVTKETGVQLHIVGFDTGSGMPPSRSYKDHPELYRQGDFPMNAEALGAALPPFARLVIGDVRTTVPEWLRQIPPSSPIGFVSLDLDYYFSTKDALQVLDGAPEQYLPRVLLYVDDIEDEYHNSYCGASLALNEFNAEHELRKIEAWQFLRGYRLFKNARWIDHMFTCQVLDHPLRQATNTRRLSTVVLENPYVE
jgi:hypothetical protein